MNIASVSVSYAVSCLVSLGRVGLTHITPKLVNCVNINGAGLAMSIDLRSNPWVFINMIHFSFHSKCCRHLELNSTT